ncbi:putative RNA-directed DNA polymerase from transposon X-element [Lucilia cuprina]|nr:putative RNA-directed DNA polymerase from transposon X-element [Lucilia cuprina]
MMTLRGSTPARDKITYAMIKHSPHILKERLCQLYNRIMTTGVYPHDWKLAVLTPIPKPGKNQSQIDGYRPISLLPVLSKLFEKILAKRFWKLTKGQISKLQHAFIPRHGVHSICHQLEEILRRNLGNGKHSLVLSEDLEKAFDRVISSSVIMELHRWGVPVQILQLVKSFLENRRITVKVDGYFSSTYNLDNGVPQGSPLSVVLYNIYANSLANAIQDLPGIDYVGIYADNIFVVASGNPKSVQISLNNMDRVIQNWSKENGAVSPRRKLKYFMFAESESVTITQFVWATRTCASWTR